MKNIFLVAGIISFVFLIVKFVEMRLIDKESKPLKFLVRDTLMVFFSVIVGDFIVEQLGKEIGGNPADNISNPAVFTDNPGF